MTAQAPKTLERYVQVLDQKVQQAQAHQAQAHTQLLRTQAKLTQLQDIGQRAQLKKSVRNVALYGNAAGFRSSVMDMVQQFRDVSGVQQLELAQAQQRMQQAMRCHESMAGVLEQTQSRLLQHQARQAQKVMDEMASQAWLRQRRAATGNC